jgi:hypothetical protein
LWKDEDTGEYFSEKTITVPYGNKWVVMPTVAEDGSQYTEDQISEYVNKYGPIDYITGEKLPVFESIEQADIYASTRSNTMLDNEEPTEFAKGGINMEKQMELFEDGGLMEEGGMVDEVSGNDVPPGSNRKEVRDDIPAMLSEGEFVFPADVVRYFGLERLMEMRQQAKMGLKRMEDMGQMGNSEEAVLPDDLPFTLEDLEFKEPQEFNQGGMVQAQQGMFIRPSVFEGTQLSTPAFIPPSSMPPVTPQGTPTGYLPTFVGQPPVSTVTAPVDTGTTTDTGTDFVPTVEDMYTFEKYINQSTGEIRDFPFYMGQPVIPIPAGFVPYSEGETTETEDVTDTGVQTAQVLAEEDRGDNFDISTGTPTGQETIPVGSLSNEDLMSKLNQSRMLARASGAMGAVINPAIGAVVGVAAKARYNDLLEEAQRRGLDTGGAERMGSVFGGESSLYEGLQDFSGDEKVTFADTWLGDLLGLDGKAGVQGPGLQASREGARRGATTTATPTPARAVAPTPAVAVPEPSQPVAVETEQDRLNARMAEAERRNREAVEAERQRQAEAQAEANRQAQEARAEAERQRQAAAQAEANRQAQAARAEAERQRQAAAQAEANRQAQESRGDDRPASWDGGRVAETQSRTSYSSSSEARAAASRAAERSGTGMATRGRAAGGFITKPEEQPTATPKKKRGIAARNKK